MSFLHSAFIENTQEAREWLESIGRNPFVDWLGDSDYEGYYIVCLNDNYHLTTVLPNVEYVDCRGNFELFKAVTALRDDSSLMQWFKSENNEWILNDGNCKEDLDYGVEICVGLFYPYWHKATLEELIEHFKTKTI